MGETYAVIGAGGHAKVVIDALISSGCHLVNCYDDNPALWGTEPVKGVFVKGPATTGPGISPGGELAIIAIGENRLRYRVASALDVRYGAAVAPSAVLGSGVAIGLGTMVLPSATINIDSVVGRHVILNTSCSVDHDCRIGDFAHIAPGTTLGGDVEIGEGAFLGVGVRVVPGIRIGRWSVIGAGAVVTKDIPDNCTAVGVPAKGIKTREAGWHLR